MKVEAVAASFALAVLWGAPASAQPDTSAALRCPPSNCPAALITNPGTTIDAKTGRKYFLDVPKDLKPGEPILFVLNLHGGGSYGNWQRHYFPIVDQKDNYRLVIATPSAPPRFWRPEDDGHLQNIVDDVFARFGAKNIKAFWLAGHSQGGATSRRIICSPYFAPKVDGFLSLSGGRVGGQPTRAQGAGRPPQRTEAPGATPAPSATPAAGSPSAPAPDPTCDFSHIYAVGEHEIAALPETSAWAAKYGCGPRVRRRDVVDTQPGVIFDSTRQDPPSKAWGRLPRPGTAQIYVYEKCRGGRLVADVVRIDKGHTEGLEPKITEELVKLMVAAPGGKARPAS